MAKVEEKFFGSVSKFQKSWYLPTCEREWR